jgi:hypothetical protein
LGLDRNFVKARMQAIQVRDYAQTRKSELCASMGKAENN